MTRKRVRTLLLLCALLCLTACTNGQEDKNAQKTIWIDPSITPMSPQTLEPPTETPGASDAPEAADKAVAFDTLQAGYAFADEIGENLLLKQAVSDPAALVYAVGADSACIAIRHSEHQAGNAEKNTMRDTAENFENLEGERYASDAPLVSNASYFLLSAEAQKSLIPYTVPKRDDKGDFPEAEAGLREAISAAKGRAIAQSEQLAEFENGARLVLCTFERKGDDMLASLVYCEGEQLAFLDFPAEYNEQSTWRADGGDSPGLFQALFLLRTDGGLVLGYTWAAPEGENLGVVRIEANSIQETDLGGNRYWSPA